MHSHRRFRQVKHRRDLLGGELLAALEEHGRPLLRGELLDGLPDLVHVSLRTQGLGGIHERRRQPLDGIALTLLATPAPAEEPPPSPPPALMVQTAVDEDAVEPRRELRLPREGPRRLVQADERFLGAILGVFPVAHDGPGDAIRPLLVALHEVVEGSPIPVRDSLAQRFIGRRESLHWRRSSHMVVGEPKTLAGTGFGIPRLPSARLPVVRRHRLAVRLQGRVLGQFASPGQLSSRLAAGPLSSNGHVLGRQQRSTYDPLSPRLWLRPQLEGPRTPRFAGFVGPRLARNLAQYQGERGATVRLPAAAAWQRNGPHLVGDIAGRARVLDHHTDGGRIRAI